MKHFQVLIEPLKPEKPKNGRLARVQIRIQAYLPRGNLAVGHWLLRLRKEEEQGDQESQTNQTEERPTRDQGDLRVLRKTNLQNRQADEVTITLPLLLFSPVCQRALG